MDFFKKHLQETLETIKTFNNGVITVKRIRIVRGVKSSNRSTINFMWRALKNLVAINFLEVNGLRSPQSYRLKYPEVEINIVKIVSRVLRERRNYKTI